MARRIAAPRFLVDNPSDASRAYQTPSWLSTNPSDAARPGGSPSGSSLIDAIGNIAAGIGSQATGVSSAAAAAANGAAPSAAPSTGKPKSLLDQLIDAQRGLISTNYTNAKTEASATAEQINAIYQGAAEAIRRLNVPGSVQGAYQGAANQTAAYSQGFSHGMQMKLNDSGQQINGDLSAIGAPAGQQVDPGKAEAAANVLYGLTGAIPARTLTQQGASAFDYYSGIPGAEIKVGADTAAGTLADLLRKAGEARDTSTAQLESNIPGWTLDQRKYDESVREYNTNRSDNLNAGTVKAASARAKQATTDAQAAYNNWIVAQRLGLSKSEIALSYKRYQLAAQKAADATGKVQTAGTPYYVDPSDGSLKLKPNYTTDASGTVVPRYKPAKPGTAKGPKTPTPNQINTLVDSWFFGKDSSVTDTRTENGLPVLKNGKPVTWTHTKTQGQLSYQDAYKRLRAMNLNDSQARTYLDTRWERGQGGRPWVNVDERITLRRAGAQPTARYFQNVVYLDARQVAALKKVGKLPQGHEAVDGTGKPVWVIGVRPTGATAPAPKPKKPSPPKQQGSTAHGGGGFGSGSSSHSDANGGFG